MPPTSFVGFFVSLFFFRLFVQSTTLLSEPHCSVNHHIFKFSLSYLVLFVKLGKLIGLLFVNHHIFLDWCLCCNYLHLEVS